MSPLLVRPITVQQRCCLTLYGVSVFLQLITSSAERHVFYCIYYNALLLSYYCTYVTLTCIQVLNTFNPYKNNAITLYFYIQTKVTYYVLYNINLLFYTIRFSTRYLIGLWELILSNLLCVCSCVNMCIWTKSYITYTLYYRSIM